MTIEDAIVKAVDKAVENAIKPYYNALMKELSELKAKQKTENTSEKMSFLLPGEAAERLKVSRPTLDKLIKDGNFKTSTSPGGRRRILESSVNEYIAREAGL